MAYNSHVNIAIYFLGGSKMKKASKIVGLLLSLIMTVVMLAGCPTDGDDDDKAAVNPTEFNDKVNPTVSSTTFNTYYIKVVDTAKPAPYNDISEFARLHFHLPRGSGFKLKEIFVNATATETGKTTLFDFTRGNDITSCTVSPAYTSTVAAGTLNGSEWVLDNSNGVGEQYPGNLGFGLGGGAYVGFVIANISTTSTFDNLQLEFMKAGDVSYQSKAAAWYFGFANQPVPPPPPKSDKVANWTTVWFDYSVLDDTPNVLTMHIDGNSEIGIQKIFVNSSASETGAVTLFDFTQNPPVFSGTDWWSAASSFTAFYDSAKSCYYLSTTGAYSQGGRMGMPDFGGKTHIGFRIKAENGLGDVRFELGKDDSGTYTNLGIPKFVDLLP